MLLVSTIPGAGYWKPSRRVLLLCWQWLCHLCHWMLHVAWLLRALHLYRLIWLLVCPYTSHVAWLLRALHLYRLIWLLRAKPSIHGVHKRILISLLWIMQKRWAHWSCRRVISWHLYEGFSYVQWSQMRRMIMVQFLYHTRARWCLRGLILWLLERRCSPSRLS